MAHYHVGIDQPCLPAGKTIVKGTPSWVHFGDGKSEFDTQLAPGKHKLSLQIGDDAAAILLLILFGTWIPVGNAVPQGIVE